HAHEMLRIQACFVSLSFAGLVVLARSLNPIPSRTRPLNSSAPMVLWLKPWESRSLPGLPRTKQFLFTCHDQTKRRFPPGRRRFVSARPQVFSFNLMFVRSHASGSVCLARPSGLNTCTVPCALVVSRIFRTFIMRQLRFQVAAVD